MKKQTITFLGSLMILVAVLSFFYFVFRIQDLFQNHLTRYSRLFEKGLTGRCLTLDVMMYIYIVTILFKNLYYVIGGILILSFVEFGRELGLLAAIIGFVTEASFRLMHLLGTDPSVVTPFSISPFFLFLIGISIHSAFFYVLTRKPTQEYLKREIAF